MEKKEFINYAPMLSMTERYSDEKLDEIIAEYTSEQKKAYSEYQKSADNYNFFKKNIDGLNYMKAERRRIKIAKEFTLKSEHIKLLSIMDFRINEENVLVGVLGSEKQIASVIGIKAFDQNGDYFEEDSKMINRLIEELQYAINAIIKGALANVCVQQRALK